MDVALGDNISARAVEANKCANCVHTILTPTGQAARISKLKLKLPGKKIKGALVYAGGLQNIPSNISFRNDTLSLRYTIELGIFEPPGWALGTTRRKMIYIYIYYCPLPCSCCYDSLQSARENLYAYMYVYVCTSGRAPNIVRGGWPQRLNYLSL
jgi:hypothetical protein